MAVYRNIAPEERDIPLASGSHSTIVQPGDTFELDDKIARQFVFPPSIFEVVEPPAEVEPPAVDAPRSEWVEHVVDTFGIRRDVLVSLDQADLVARYGPKADEVEPPHVDAPRDVWAAYGAEQAGVAIEDLDDLDKGQIIDGLGLTPPGQPSRPADSAKKQAWVDYALSLEGVTEADVEGLTQADLISKYGEV